MARVAMLVLGAALCATAPVHAETALRRATGGQLLADVRVGGAAATPFQIDTGAAGCGVAQRFAAERRLLAIAGPDGARVRTPAIEIDGFALGALPCALLEGGPADGVLGVDALARFVVVVDAPRMRLSLHGGAQHGQALVSPRARLVYVERLAGGLLAVPVTLNGARGVGIIDTGAGRSVFNRRFVEAAGAAGEPRGALALAGRTRTVDVRASDAAVFEALGLEHTPAMVLGLDVLGDLKLVLDYPRRRVWFDPG
jgi:predicted aspartyl protease